MVRHNVKIFQNKIMESYQGSVNIISFDNLLNMQWCSYWICSSVRSIIVYSSSYHKLKSWDGFDTSEPTFVVNKTIIINVIFGDVLLE